MSAKDYELMLCKNGYLYINKREGNDFRSDDSKILSKEDIAEIAMWYKKQTEKEYKDLEEAGKEWIKSQLDNSYKPYGEDKMMALTKFDGYNMLDAIEFGANYKKQQIEKACTWLEENADMFEAFDSDSKTYYMDKVALVEQFKKIIGL